MENNLLTIVPYFDGFYDSFSSERVEEALGVSENDVDYIEECNPIKEGETKELYIERIQSIFMELYDKADFAGMQKEYAKSYVENFAEDNNIKLEFESLSSPREYNFTTDRIFAYIPIEEVKRLVLIVDRVKLAAMAKEKFTSRDGFSSFYSNDLEEWKIDEIEDLDHNQIETIIECVTAEHFEEENENYPYVLSLMEDFYR